MSRSMLSETVASVSEMAEQIDEARDVAAALAHAYIANNHPPQEALAKARAWLQANLEAADE